jgi:superfamily II DNA or RNA helicase
MNGTKVGRRGYVVLKKDLSEEELAKVRAELTVTPAVMQAFGPMAATNTTPIKLYKENDAKIYVPRFYGQDRWKVATKTEFPEHPERDRLVFDKPLLPHQVDVAAKSLDDLHKTGGAFLCLGCGMGKTALALYLSAHLKKRTLVVVHKTFLLDQWVERIRQFVPEAKIGVIRGKTLDIGDNDYVIGMLQSLSMKDYDKSAFDEFGTVIVDEAHHIGSEVFSRALPLIQTRYMIGLSATPKRKDGLSCVFHWYLGKITFKLERKETMGMLVHRVFLPEDCGLEEATNFRGQVMLPKMINDLAGLEPRNRWIVGQVRDWLERGNAEEARQIIILGNRLEQLRTLKKTLDDMHLVHPIERRPVTTGYYIGGAASKKKQDELKDSENCDVILGTFAMACEGLDIPSLNTLMLVTPISDVEQASGRILRKPHKVRPVVIDLIDTYSESLKRQGGKRYRFYKKQGYDIVNTSLRSWDAHVPDPISSQPGTPSMDEDNPDFDDTDSGEMVF